MAIDDAEEAAARSRAPAVARAATVLRLLAREKAGLGVTEIARRVDLVPSTCLHVLRALVEEGFVAFDSDKKTYRTGVGLFTLVRDAMTNSDFPTAVQPSIEHLATEHQVTAVAVELDSRDRMVVMALARADSLISLHINVGSRFPSLISATGRCVAAASGESKEELRARFEALRWERAPKFDDWFADVQRTAKEGVALDRGNFVRGLTVMSTLLPASPDRAVRGIAAIGLDHHMSERSLQRLRESLVEEAKATAARLMH